MSKSKKKAKPPKPSPTPGKNNGPTVREQLEYAERIIVVAREVLKPIGEGAEFDTAAIMAIESLLVDAEVAVEAVLGSLSPGADERLLEVRTSGRGYPLRPAV